MSTEAIDQAIARVTAELAGPVTRPMTLKLTEDQLTLARGQYLNIEPLPVEFEDGARFLVLAPAAGGWLPVRVAPRTRWVVRELQSEEPPQLRDRIWTP